MGTKNLTKNEDGTFSYVVDDLAALASAFFDNLEIQYGEYGGIGLDCKRPFGNSDVESDILELIGEVMEGNDGEDDCWSSKQRDYARSLYHEKLIPYLKKVYGSSRKPKTS